MPDLETHHLTDDGDIPNNAHLPLILYRRALDVQAEDAEHCFEELFKTNGWGGSWVDSIYPFHHYHSTAHEVLGIARGRVRVQFGGRRGPSLEVEAGDAVFIPAGVGHCRIGADAGLAVVGAYPEGQDWDLRREGETDRESIRSAIARVPLPERDPVLGTAFLSHSLPVSARHRPTHGEFRERWLGNRRTEASRFERESPTARRLLTV